MVQKLLNPHFLKSHDALLDYNLSKTNYKNYPCKFMTFFVKCLTKYEQKYLKNLDDFNRVKLSTINGIEGSDFINASFIEVKFEISIT